MFNNKKQSGFLVVIIILAVVAVVALCYVGWHMWSARRSSTLQYSNDNSTQDSSQSYIVIGKWGVRFKPVIGLEAGVQYFAPKSSNVPASEEIYEFSSQALVNREPNCATSSFLAVDRTTKSSGIAGTLVASIGGYNYYIQSTGAACSTDSANADFESQQNQLIKNSLRSLEAVK